MLRVSKLGIHMQMDEMLKARQDQAAARSFWALLVLCHALCFFQILGLGHDISQAWPLLTVSIFATIYYIVSVIRSGIPLLPRFSLRTLSLLLAGTAVAMGAFIGIRNVFFLYAENMARYSLPGKIGMAAQITGVLALQFALLNGLDFLLFYLLDRWQQRRIERTIEEESQD